MKRTAMIAIVIAALTFGVVGFALATDRTVVVTANVTPAFEFTLQGPAALTLTADPLTTPVATVGSSLRVRSNMPWTFTQQTPVYSNALFGTFMSDTVSVANGLQTRGVTPITTSYTLNLGSDAAYSLPVGAYTATYVYTAVQN
ncbi:MAG: hypothetical protein KGZ40_02670 [Clostridiales bacterium]|nr:hypothetical protein [Clostridiales bacterium]